MMILTLAVTRLDGPEISKLLHELKLSEFFESIVNCITIQSEYNFDFLPKFKLNL